jgi:hypothetical protein
MGERAELVGRGVVSFPRVAPLRERKPTMPNFTPEELGAIHKAVEIDYDSVHGLLKTDEDDRGLLREAAVLSRVLGKLHGGGDE